MKTKKIAIVAGIVTCTILSGCASTSNPQEVPQSQTGEVSVYDAASWKTSIRDSCQSFYDGCNQCFKTSGDVAACTMKACEVYTEPYCTDEQVGAIANDFYNAQAYVGLSVEEAQEKARKDIIPFRIVSIDGEPQPITKDSLLGRINASTSGGYISAISIEGQGWKEYIGLSVEEAQEKAKQDKRSLRILQIDDQQQPVELDFVQGRLNAIVQSGKIISINQETKDNYQLQLKQASQIPMLKAQQEQLHHDNQITIQQAQAGQAGSDYERARDAALEGQSEKEKLQQE